MIFVFYTNKCFKWTARLFSKHILNSTLTEYPPIKETNSLFFIFYSPDMFPIIKSFIKNYIIIQLEQHSSKIFDNETKESVEYLDTLKNAKAIWDYSKLNIEILSNKFPYLADKIHYFQLNNNMNKSFPVIYEINKPIYPFFVGSLSSHRRHLIEKIGINVIDNLYDIQLYEFLKKTKNPVLINMHFNYKDTILEIVRINEILSYGIKVISEKSDDNELDSLYSNLISINDLELITKKDIEKITFTLNKEYVINPIIPDFDGKDYNDTILLNPLKIDMCPKFDMYKFVVEKEEIKWPNISVIVRTTETRKKLLSIVSYNLRKMDYPQSKIELIRIDDSETNNIVDKLNLGIKKAKNDIVIIMDDDDFHYNLSFKVKVYLLTKNVKIVGSTDYVCFNVSQKTAHIQRNKLLAEGSIAINKSKFDDSCFPLFKPNRYGESYELCQLYPENITIIPNSLNIIALSHENNYTGSIRRTIKGKTCFPFPKDFTDILTYAFN